MKVATLVVYLLLLLACMCYNERVVHASESIENLLRIQQFYPVPKAVCPWKYSKLRAISLSLNSMGEMIVATSEGFIKKISSGFVNVTTVAGCGSDANSVTINDLSMASVNGMGKIISHPNDTSIMFGLYSSSLVKMDLNSNTLKVYSDVGGDLSDGVFGGDGMLYYTAGTCIRKFDTTTETSSVYAGDCSRTDNGVSGNPFATEPLGTIKGIAYYNNDFYILDRYYHCVRKLSTSDQLLINYAGDCSRDSSKDIAGIGTNARFSKVSTSSAISSMALFKDTLYISGDSTVRKLNLLTGEVSSTYFTADENIVDIIVKKDNEVYYLQDDDKTLYKYDGHNTQSVVDSSITSKDPFPIDCLTCSSFSAIDVFRNGDLVFVCSPSGVIMKLSFKDRIVTPLIVNLNYVRGTYYMKINPFNEDELYFLTDRTLKKYTISTSDYKVITPQTTGSLPPSGVPLTGAMFRLNVYMHINPYTNEIYMIENDDNRVTMIKGGKQIPFISIKNPQSMAFKPDGTFYVFSVKDKYIYYVDANAAQTKFSYAGNLQKMAWYDDSLYYLTTSGESVAKVDNTGAFTTLTTSPSNACGGSSIDFLFNGTYIYILCAKSLVRHPIVGGTVETIDGSLPSCSSFTMVNNEFIIACKDDNYVIKKRIEETVEPYIGQLGSSSGPIEGPIQEVRLNAPYSVTSDNNGDLYVMLGTAIDDYRNIIKVSNGVSTYFAGQGDGLSVETTIFGAIDSFDFLRNGEIVVESTSLRAIQSDGTVKTILGHNGYAISDAMITNSVVTAAPFSTVIPSFFTMTVDRSTGALYFSTALTQIQELYNNTYRPVIGSGAPGYTGDGAQAQNANIDNDSNYMYFDGSRKALIFCDSNNNVVRMVSSDGIVSTIIGSGQVGSGFITNGAAPLTLDINKPRFVVSNGDDMFIAEGTSSGTPRLYRVMGCDKNGWTGEHCNIPTCYGLANYSSGVCMGNGVCSSSDNCTCYTGFFGLQCNDFNCNNVHHSNSSVCSGHGKCTTADTCVCNRDGNIIYYGNNCENKKCYGNYAGDACDQYSCFNVLSGNSSVCSGHGSCTNTDTCSCKKDGNIIYYGNNCELKKCYGNYTGDACDQISCFNVFSTNSSVCSSHGTCTNTDTCVCKQDGNIIYYGDNCENRKCYGNYAGNACDQYSCFNVLSGNSSVCSSHGTCNNTDTCICKQDRNIIYYGNNCELKKCYGNYTGNACDQFSCFNVLSGNSSVCSGHGSCTNTDTCSCKQDGNIIYYGDNCESRKCYGNYVGPSCDQFSCFSLLSHNPSVCSGRGSCNDTDYCICKTGYTGDCSLFTCGNISSLDATSCSGKGKCVDYNTCNCDLFYYGNNCQNFNESGITCGGVSFVSNRTCSGHGNCTAQDTCKCQNEGNLIHYGSNCELNKCLDNYYGSYCSAFCKQDLNCSSHGVCNNEGLCTCNYDGSKGFYVGSSCSECEADYYGDKCLTKFLPSKTLLSNNGLEISMKLYAPISYNANSIDCSKVIHPQNISLLGSNVECLWSDKTNGNFTIRLGVSKSVLIDSVIKVNVNAFSTLPTPSPQYIDTTINAPIAPTVPVAIISNVGGALLGICDEISIDGSKSYNIDKNELLYEWSLLDCPVTALQMAPSKTSNWLFASSTPVGDYSVQLIVKSKYLDWKSSPAVYNFTKYDILLPQISISGNTLISNKNFPLLIKKYEIWENTCGANIPDKSLFTYSWVQLEGGSTNFTQQSTNDILLTSVKDYSYQKYVFQVTLYYKQFKSSNQITIYKTQDTFNLVLYQSMVDYTSVVVNVQIDPLISSNYANSLPWVWTCKLPDGSNCEASLLNQLAQHSSSRSTTFKLTTTVKASTINLKLQVNTIESTLTVKFSTDVIVVDVLSVYPVKSFYNLEDVLSASFLVSINGKSDGINSLIQRSWTLNDKSISASSLSNNVDLPLSSLSPGSTNTLRLTVTSIQSKESSSNSVIFKMVTPPPTCKCTISPSSGVALESTFSISCPNCITSDQTLQVGFVDFNTGIKVPLTTAASLSVPLPYTGSTTLSLYATVTNVNTLAAVSSTFKAQVQLPSAVSATEVKKKKTGWDTTYKSLAVGNPKKIVFGYITTVVTAMYDALLATAARRSICPPGYTKKDCSMTMADWQDVTSDKVNTTKMIFDSFTRDSLAEKVNGEILAMQTLAIYRAVERVDEVNGELFDLCWNTYKNQLQEALLEENMELSSQLMDFLSLTLSYLKQSREFIDGNRTSTTFKSELTTVANDLTTLNSRNIRVGSSFTVNVGSYELTVSKLYPADLSERLFTISNAMEGVRYPNMSTQYIQNVDLRKVIYQRVVQKYINTEDIYNFKNSTKDVNVTISGIPYVLSTEITNQEMIIPKTSSVLSYVFHYIKSTESYDSSSVVFTSEILCISDSPCIANDLGNDLYSCVCGPSTNVTIAEKRTLRAIPQPTPVEKSAIPSQKVVPPTTSNDLGYLGFIALGVVVIVLVVIVLIVVIVILRMKKKSNPAPSLPSMSANKGVEMHNV